MPRQPQPPLAGGAEDLHTWLEQVAAHQLASVSSKLGARALKQDAASRPGSRSSAVLRPSASRPSTAGGQPSGEFYLYRGKMLPKGGWQHDPLRTEVSHLQHEMHHHRSSPTMSLQRDSIERSPEQRPPQPQRWSTAASAAELRYGYRWGEGGTAGSPGSGARPRTASATAAAAASRSPHSPHSPPPRPPFSEMISGSLFEDMPPPPPPSDVPEEYHIYDMQAERKQVTLGESAKRNEAYRIFPAVQPSNRSQVTHPCSHPTHPQLPSYLLVRPPRLSQVVHLAATLERMLAKAGPRTMEALQAWDVCFSELVRQVFVQCNDRGELLGRVRRAQQHGRWLTTAPMAPLGPPRAETPKRNPANDWELVVAIGCPKSEFDTQPNRFHLQALLGAPGAAGAATRALGRQDRTAPGDTPSKLLSAPSLCTNLHPLALCTSLSLCNTAPSCAPRWKRCAGGWASRPKRHAGTSSRGCCAAALGRPCLGAPRAVTTQPAPPLGSLPPSARCRSMSKRAPGRR